MGSGTPPIASYYDESNSSSGTARSPLRATMTSLPRRMRPPTDHFSNRERARIAEKGLWFSWRPSPDKPGRRHDRHPCPNAIDRSSATTDHDAHARPTRNRRDLRPVSHLRRAHLPPPTGRVGPFLSNADRPMLPAVRIDVLYAEAKTPMERVHRDFVQPEF